MHVGNAHDVAELLATQPSETAAIAAELSADELVERIRHHLEAQARRPDAEVMAAVRAAMRRERDLTAALRLWCDDMLAQSGPQDIESGDP